MKVTGQDVINKIVKQLNFENIPCTDSAIVHKLRKLTAGEVMQLYALGSITKWHNANL